MKKANYIITLTGIILIGLGVYLLKNFLDLQGFMQAFPYVCIGVGGGVFGHGMGNILSQKAIQKTPEIGRQLEIEKNDERNIAIANRAKAKAYDLMTFVFSALMIVFVLMRVDFRAVLLLVFAYLLVHGYAIYFRLKYDKEM